MGAITSPREICVWTMCVLSTNSCLSGLTWWDWRPNPATVFNELPAGVVDFDLEAAGFEQMHRGVKVTFPPLLVELLVEITETDVGGQSANSQIWIWWWCLVHALFGNRYLGKTVDGCRILGGRVEGIPIETEETGITARYAWVSLETWKNL